MTLLEATVLLVDDEPELLRFLQQWFERAGCRVLTAGHGLDALGIVQNQHVDLVISDIRMPIMDGIELARRLKTGPYIPKMIFVSGFADVEDRALYDLGVEAKLEKPVRRQDLINQAQRCLADREERWRTPPVTLPKVTLASSFESLAKAQTEGAIAFGRGGCCLVSRSLVHDDDLIGLAISFEADRRGLVGQGIVRWTDAPAQAVGIEITHVDDANRAWFVALTGHRDIRSFIPATCDAPASGERSSDPALGRSGQS